VGWESSRVHRSRYSKHTVVGTRENMFLR
jgi:hypothetical protein